MSATENGKPAVHAVAGRTKQSQPKSGPAETDQAGSGNVDKIREILFGNQMRDFDSRTARLEQSLAEAIAELRKSTLKRLETLESYFTKELEALAASHKSEREERVDAVKKLTQEMKHADEALAKKVDAVSDQGIAAQRELRAEGLKQSKGLRDEITRLQAELGALLDQRFQELGRSKTDRAALAAILTEAALRLADEQDLPAAKG